MNLPQFDTELDNHTPDVICVVADSNLTGSAVDGLIADVKTRFDGIPVHSMTLKGGEAVKTPETLTQIWSLWQEQGLSRSSLVIATGGGTITDVVGFAASTFKRGMRWIAVPTTLLCMVDAAIGGKTGINAAGIKNLAGSFWPPLAVWTQPVWLNTLPQIELWNGWMEMAKHALVGDAQSWDQTSATSPLRATTEELFQWALRSAAFKQQIVANDPVEKGERKILNFGHTLAHAIEACSHEDESGSGSAAIPHGIAVGWGMRWSLRWSSHTFPAFAAELNASEAVLTRWLEEAHWGQRPAFATDALWQKILGDKKNRSGVVLDIALEGIGRPKWDQAVSWEVFESVWQQLD